MHGLLRPAFNHHYAKSLLYNFKFSSVIVGKESSVFGDEASESDEEDIKEDEDGTAAFSSSWLPGNDKYCSFSLFIFHWQPHLGILKHIRSTQISLYFLSDECFAFRIKQEPTETKRKRKKHQKERTAVDDDIVEDLVLSSDEDLPSSDSPSAGKNADVDNGLPKKQNRKPKHKTKRLKRN